MRCSQSAVVLLSCTFTAAIVAAQRTRPDAAPAFEAASIKQNRSGETLTYAPAILPGGRFSVSNATLRRLIEYAYDVDLLLSRFMLIGGSEGVLATRFDVTAVAPGGSPDDQDLRKESKLRLRTLLAERFQLRTHTEARPLPVFALTVAREGRLGPQLRRSAYDCWTWRRARSEGRQIEEPRDADGPWCTANSFTVPDAFRSRNVGVIADLIRSVQFAVDRPIEDATGLTGNLEWTLTFAMSSTRESSWPSIYTAMQEQLGLKLEPRSDPMEVRVIDSVSMPTPN